MGSTLSFIDSTPGVDSETQTDDEDNPEEPVEPVEPEEPVKPEEPVEPEEPEVPLAEAVPIESEVIEPIPEQQIGNENVTSKIELELDKITPPYVVELGDVDVCIQNDDSIAVSEREDSADDDDASGYYSNSVTNSDVSSSHKADSDSDEYDSDVSANTVRSNSSKGLKRKRDFATQTTGEFFPKRRRMNDEGDLSG